MEYCCHMWVSALNCYLDILDKLKKWLHWVIGPLLAGSLDNSVKSGQHQALL